MRWWLIGIVVCVLVILATKSGPPRAASMPNESVPVLSNVDSSGQAESASAPPSPTTVAVSVAPRVTPFPDSRDKFSGTDVVPIGPAPMIARASSIRGVKFDDSDGDGVLDPGEPPLSNWRVYIDRNYNGLFDAGERHTFTNALGEYAFTALPAGTYIVGETPQSPWSRTTPSTPAFAPAITAATQGGPRLPTAADLNGDGYPDLVLSNVYSDSISIFFNNQRGTFRFPTHLRVGDQPRDVLPADLDRDGDLDLAVTNMNSRTVSILINSGTGSFAAPVNYPADNGAWIVKAADLDRDGDPDLVVMNQLADNVSLLFNRGNGTFVAGSVLAAGDWPHGLTVADIDQDGRLDIAVANMLSANVTLYFGVGDGTFSPATQLSVGDGPLEVVPVDLDRDGLLDLVTVDLFSDDVAILKGTGPRTFAPATTMPAGQASHDLGIADFDDDGDLDIAVPGYESGDVTVFLNNGDATFAPPTVYPTGPGPLFSRPVDLDGDSDLDLVVNNIDGDELALLRNRGDGTFDSAGKLRTGDQPRFLTLSDFNLDGLPDVVVANFEGNTAALFLNVAGSHVVTLADNATADGKNFGAIRFNGTGDPPSGDHTFKLRVGTGSFKSDRFNIGNVPVTRRITIRRFRGDATSRVRVDACVVNGDAALWQVTLSDRTLLLGPGPTTSTADHDEPGTRANKPGDGDVDDDDVAAFEACRTGDGIRLGVSTITICVGFDFDGDLDVDDADRAVLDSHFTGPVSIPWNQTLNLTLRALPTAPAGSTARVQVTVTDTETGEVRSIFIRATKQLSEPGISPLFRFDFTKDRSDKLVFGRDASFELSLFNFGADRDTLEVRAGSTPGFSFQFTDPLTGLPSTRYTLSAAGEGGPEFPGSSRPLGLKVTAPSGWPRASRVTIPVIARSTTSGKEAQFDLTLTKAGPLWSPSDLTLPDGRRHLVPPGGVTTFGFLVTNPTTQAKTLTLSTTPVVAGDGWSGVLSTTQVTLDPNAQTEAILTLTAPAGAPPAQTSDWIVTLRDGASVAGVNRVGGEAHNSPKVIFVSMDGLSPEYMYLNAAGTAPGSDGDWLMPNTQALMARGTTYRDARAGLPAYTDPNHVAALSGAAVGKNGVGSVIFYYYGRDEDGAAVVKPTSSESLRFGASGDPLPTAFDVAKQVQPRSFTAFATGKGWMTNYFRRDGGGADLIVDAWNYPVYVNRPVPHVIGDPSTDPDASIDPPLPPVVANWGTAPGLFPSDEFVMESSLRVLDFEDPDVFYILMAGTDDAGHMMGAAWDLPQWDEQGTPTVWDDVNQLNPLANREELFDAVREADIMLGRLMQRLAETGKLDNTYIALNSDHGMVAFSPHQADIGKWLEQNGYSYKDDFDVSAGGAVALFFDIAPDRQTQFESLLENAPPLAAGTSFNDWVVVNRAEMRTGIDVKTGVKVGEPDELYSQYFVEQALTTPDRTRWPDFIVVFEGTAQTAPLHFDPGLGEDDSLEGEAFVGGHAGSNTSPIVMVMAGPNIPQGQVVTDPVRNVDIAPTLYHLLGWPTPGSVDGTVLPGIP